MKIKKIATPPNWQKIPYHPFSEISTFGEGIDLEDLTATIQKHGYHPNEPIVLYQDKILEGRHRHSCAAHGEVEPTFVVLEGTEAEAVEYVRKKVLRQHLNAGQRAAVISAIVDIVRKFAHNIDKPTNEDKAQEAGVSRRTVDFHAAVEKNGSAAVQRAARTGQVSFSDAASVCDRPKAEQDKALQAVRDGKAKTLAEAVGPKKPKGGRGKKKAAPPPADGVPADVANILADQWHLECARVLSKMAKEVKGALNWSHWLTGDVLVYLDNAKQCFLSAAPKRACPDCKGRKKVEGEMCPGCRGAGYLASQVLEEEVGKC